MEESQVVAAPVVGPETRAYWPIFHLLAAPGISAGLVALCRLVGLVWLEHRGVCAAAIGAIAVRS